MAEPLDEPLGVIAHDELADDPLRLGERLEPIETEALLLQCPHEAFDDAIALRPADAAPGADAGASTAGSACRRRRGRGGPGGRALRGTPPRGTACSPARPGSP